jgi:hypothetical protein
MTRIAWHHLPDVQRHTRSRRSGVRDSRRDHLPKR